MKHARKPQQIQRGNGVCRRFGPVIVFLETKEHQRIAVFVSKISAAFSIPKPFVQGLLKPLRPLQPANFKCGFVQIQQSLNQKCMVFRKSGNMGSFPPPRAVQPIRCGIIELVLNKTRRLDRGRGQFFVVQASSRTGKCRNGQSIPRRQNLVVAMGSNSLIAKLTKFNARLA